MGGAKIIKAKLVNDVSYCYCLACCSQSLRTDETIRPLDHCMSKCLPRLFIT